MSVPPIAMEGPEVIERKFAMFHDSFSEPQESWSPGYEIHRAVLPYIMSNNLTPSETLDVYGISLDRVLGSDYTVEFWRGFSRFAVQRSGWDQINTNMTTTPGTRLFVQQYMDVTGSGAESYVNFRQAIGNQIDVEDIPSLISSIGKFRTATRTTSESEFNGSYDKIVCSLEQAVNSRPERRRGIAGWWQKRQEDTVFSRAINSLGFELNTLADAHAVSLRKNRDPSFAGGYVSH